MKNVSGKGGIARVARVLADQAAAGDLLRGFDGLLIPGGFGERGVRAEDVAFSFALYSGQMCTAPQNVYVPADGVDTDQGFLGNHVGVLHSLLLVGGLAVIALLLVPVTREQRD